MISLSTSQSQTNDTPSLLCIQLELVCGSQHPSLGDHSSKTMLYHSGISAAKKSCSRFSSPNHPSVLKDLELRSRLALRVILPSLSFFSSSNSFLRSWLDSNAHFCRDKYTGYKFSFGSWKLKSRSGQNSFSCSGFHVWITSKGNSWRLILQLKLSHSM